MIRRQNVLLIIIVLLALAGGWLVYQRSYAYLSISAPSEIQAKVYKNDNSDKVETAQKPVAGFTGKAKLKLKKGDYLIVTSASPVYRSVTQTVSLSADSSLSLSPGYTEAKLSALLNSEQAQITAAAMKAYNYPSKGYVLTKGELFDKGQWYGGLLNPGSSGGDVLRIVMIRGQSGWSAVVKPPLISIGSPVYPEIPKEVLQGTNSLRN